MSKIFRRFIVFFMVFILHIYSFEAYAFVNKADLGLKSKSAILMETGTGEVLYEYNSHDKLAPASVTKVMTLLLIYEAIHSGKIKWDDMVTISEHAASMGGSQVFLESLEQQTVADLTKCISIASANDASVAMAEYIGGSEQGFVEMMNRRAKEIGMYDTVFVNACGLDAEGHLTSANDIALMSRELMKGYPEVSQYATTWMDTITHKTKRGESEFGLSNTNKLVKWYNGATGLKTGSTSKALFCVSATAQRDGMDLIAVIMGAPDSSTRFREAMQLLDYGFANYCVLIGDEEGEIVGDVIVYKGNVEEISVMVKDKVSVVYPKGEGGELTRKVDIYDSIDAPFEKGTKAGEVIYMLNDEEVGRSDVVTTEAVEKINFGKMLERLKNKWFA